MTRHQTYLDRNSNGKRGVYLAYAIISLFGAMLSFLVVNQLGGGSEILRSLGLYDIWSIIAGAIGAGTGLYAGRHWLGTSGFAGWLNAVVAIPVISFLGSLVGGTLALPIYGTMFGPMALAATFFENTLVFVFWSWTVLIAHALFVTYREGQDSLADGALQAEA